MNRKNEIYVYIINENFSIKINMRINYYLNIQQTANLTSFLVIGNNHMFNKRRIPFLTQTNELKQFF